MSFIDGGQDSQGPKSRLYFGMWCVQCNPRLTSYVCYLTPLRTLYCPQIRNVAYTSYIPTKDSSPGYYPDPLMAQLTFNTEPSPKPSFPHTNPLYGVPTTLPLPSSLIPSPLNSFFFSSIVIPSPSLGHLPLNPPRAPPVATTRWHGTSGANGLRRSALPTARGDDCRYAASRP